MKGKRKMRRRERVSVEFPESHFEHSLRATRREREKDGGGDGEREV